MSISLYDSDEAYESKLLIIADAIETKPQISTEVIECTEKSEKHETKKSNAPRWSVEATKMLISLWKKFSIELESKNLKLKKGIYQKVAAELQEIGNLSDYYNATKCRVKIASLRDRCRKEMWVTHFTSEPTKWPFYNMVYEIIGAYLSRSTDAPCNPIPLTGMIGASQSLTSGCVAKTAGVSLIVVPEKQVVSQYVIVETPLSNPSEKETDNSSDMLLGDFDDADLNLEDHIEYTTVALRDTSEGENYSVFESTEKSVVEEIKEKDLASAKVPQIKFEDIQNNHILDEMYPLLMTLEAETPEPPKRIKLEFEDYGETGNISQPWESAPAQSQSEIKLEIEVVNESADLPVIQIPDRASEESQLVVTGLQEIVGEEEEQALIPETPAEDSGSSSAIASLQGEGNDMVNNVDMPGTTNEQCQSQEPIEEVHMNLEVVADNHETEVVPTDPLDISDMLPNEPTLNMEIEEEETCDPLQFSESGNDSDDSRTEETDESKGHAEKNHQNKLVVEVDLTDDKADSSERGSWNTASNAVYVEICKYNPKLCSPDCNSGSSNYVKDHSIDCRQTHCSKCNFTFNGKKRWKLHMQSVHGCEYISCDNCSMIFSDKKALENHFLPDNLNCEDCSLVFNKKCHLNQHNKLIHGKDIGSLAKCVDESRSRRGLKNTTKAKAVSVPNVLKQHHQFMCHDCRNVFPSLKLLSNHYHYCGMSWKSFECTECSLRFPTNEALTSHYVTGHRYQIQFKCPVCEESFENKKLLVLHVVKLHNMSSVVPKPILKAVV